MCISDFWFACFAKISHKLIVFTPCKFIDWDSRGKLPPNVEVLVVVKWGKLTLQKVSMKEKRIVNVDMVYIVIM